MTQRSVSSQGADETSPATAPRRRLGDFIKAALEGWLAMAGRSAAAAPYQFPPF